LKGNKISQLTSQLVCLGLKLERGNANKINWLGDEDSNLD